VKLNLDIEEEEGGVVVDVCQVPEQRLLERADKVVKPLQRQSCIGYNPHEQKFTGSLKERGVYSCFLPLSSMIFLPKKKPLKTHLRTPSLHRLS